MLATECCLVCFARLGFWEKLLTHSQACLLPCVLTQSYINEGLIDSCNQSVAADRHITHTPARTAEPPYILFVQ